MSLTDMHPHKHTNLHPASTKLPSLKSLAINEFPRLWRQTPQLTDGACFIYRKHMLNCDAHDARVSVLQEVCVYRVTVLHATCVYISFRVLYAAVSIMYSCMMGLSLATARAAVVHSVYSKWGFIIALSVISN